MSIGSRIKLRREELGLTQPELAKMIGVSKGSIGNYESEISCPNENILIKLFSALDCDANYLYYDDINKTDEQFDSYEKAVIKKYRTLDNYGKKAIDALLEIEFTRCLEAEKPATASTITVRSAARSDDGSVAAGTTTITEEQLKKLQNAPTIKDL